jgi:hypothetical protein
MAKIFDNNTSSKILLPLPSLSRESSCTVPNTRRFSNTSRLGYEGGQESERISVIHAEGGPDDLPAEDSHTQRDKLLHDEPDLPAEGGENNKNGDIESGAGANSATAPLSEDKNKSKDNNNKEAGGATPKGDDKKAGSSCKETTKSCCTQFWRYIMFFTDNVFLFSYEMVELLRFEEKPIGIFDKCRSCCWIIIFAAFWVGVGFSIDYTSL